MRYNPRPLILTMIYVLRTSWKCLFLYQPGNPPIVLLFHPIVIPPAVKGGGVSPPPSIPISIIRRLGAIDGTSSLSRISWIWVVAKSSAPPISFVINPDPLFAVANLPLSGINYFLTHSSSSDSRCPVLLSAMGVRLSLQHPTSCRRRHVSP